MKLLKKNYQKKKINKILNKFHINSKDIYLS